MVIKGGLARLTKAQLIAEVERLQKAADKTYNGWPNYETWLVNIHLGNDSATYDHVQEMAWQEWDNAGAFRDGEPGNTLTRSDRARHNLAEMLKDWIDENNPLADAGSMYTDLVTSSLCEVNWHCLADAWLEGRCGKDGYETWR